MDGSACVLAGSAEGEEVVGGLGDGGAEDLEFEVAVSGVEGDGHVVEGTVQACLFARRGEAQAEAAWSCAPWYSARALDEACELE